MLEEISYRFGVDFGIRRFDHFSVVEHHYTVAHTFKLTYEPWSSTSYGEPAGLLGINCGHFIYPFIPGYSVKRNEPTQDKEANDRLYEQRQQQRQMERTLRAYKRSAAMLEAAGQADAAEGDRKKAAQVSRQIRDFCAETGLTRRRDRERVYTE